MIRGVIFDMDGVLVDTEPFYHQRRIDYLHGKGVAVEPSLDLTGSNETSIWEALVPDGGRLREELKRGYRVYQERYPTPFGDLLDPQVTPVFRELKRLGLRLAIASSSDMGCIREMMAVAKIEDLVDYCISGEECCAHKPNPEIYMKALGGLGIAAGEAVAVEDSPIGIAAARNAGIVVYALQPNRAGTVRDLSRADGCIASLAEILRFVSPGGLA